MRIAAITGVRQCALVERPLPKIRDNYCLIKVLVAPACTECQDYKAGRVGESIGHEAAGVVVEVARSGKVAVGDRVVVMPSDPCGVCALCLAGDYIFCTNPNDPLALCSSATGRATYAEYLIQQDWMLLPIPQGVSMDHASLACCGLGPSFNAIQTMQVVSTDTVLVSGLGAVGLGAVINARVRGARVLGLDSNPWRAELAAKLGAEAVIDPTSPDALDQINGLTGGMGADKSIEASSAPAALGFLARATRRKGEIATIGWGGGIEEAGITGKGLTIRGTWHWNHLRHVREMFQTIRLARPLLDVFVTHRFSLENVQAAWEQQLTGQTGKVLLYPFPENKPRN